LDAPPRRLGKIVPFDHRHTHFPRPHFFRYLPDAASRAARVGGPEIAHHRDAAFQAAPKDRPQHRLQERCVAAVRVVSAFELRQGKGPLGEHLEDQHARTASRD
jgi:hypothetical protein